MDKIQLLAILLVLALVRVSSSYNCDADQYFNDQRCAPCQQNCKCKKQGECDSCISGYTFDSTFKNCVRCPIATDAMHVGCAQCCYQISGTAYLCSSCPNLSDTFLIGGQCLRVLGCSSLAETGMCESCRDGYYLQNGLCVQCDASCSKCVGPTFCLSCKTGYYADNAIHEGNCQSCSTGCSVCSSSTSCTTCQDGFKLNGAVCQVCPTLCQTCSSSGCLSCKTGSALIGSDCFECTDTGYGGTAGCNACTASGSAIKCSKCNDGYYLTSSKTCQSCNNKFSNSALCTESQLIQCRNDHVSNLENRYYKMGNSCVINSKLCKTMADSSGKCSSCYFQSGKYYKLSSGTCQLCEQEGCSTYSSSTCQCTGCQNMYQYVNAQCIPCQNPHCYKCQSSVTLCQQCAPYYGLISSACISCTQAECLNCDGDTSYCSTCLDGYYVSSGVCYLCQNSCSLCISATQCTKCLSGYYLHENGRCKRLPTNCAEVNENGNCQKCQYSYQLKFGYCFPCSPQMFNLKDCDKFCPSYYAELTHEHKLIYSLILAIMLLICIF